MYLSVMTQPIEKIRSFVFLLFVTPKCAVLPEIFLCKVLLTLLKVTVSGSQIDIQEFNLIAFWPKDGYGVIDSMNSITIWQLCP